jgi:hypothetical protein
MADWNNALVSYAVSHLRSAVTVLREQGLTQEADEVTRIADHVEVLQVERTQ